MERFPNPVSKLNLHLDITAVLLAEHLEILSFVEQAFAPLNIPAELIPSLIQLRESLTPHQPARFAEHKQIIELVNNGAINVLNDELSSEIDNSSLIEEMGQDWVILADTTKRNNGFLVDYLPLKRNDLSGNPSSTLPDDIDTILINCRAIVESLLQEGPIPSEEYYRALEELGNEGQVKPSQTIPHQGSLLYCNGAIPETLAGANLLAIVCQRFQVHICNQTYKRIKAGFDSYPYMQTLAEWVDNLISRLNTGLDNHLYQIIPIAPDKRKQLNGIRLQHPLNGTLATLLGFEIEEGDVIWADDRFFNSYRHRDGVPIADVYDILKLLVGVRQMSEADYYRSLHKLRLGNVIFIPIQRDEIVYHLKQARIRPTTSTVVETQQLKVIRQYVAACLLQKTILQKPPLPSSSPNMQGETVFVINFMRAVSSALFDIWVDNDLLQEDRPVLCEWIVNNLYLDYLALFHAASLPVEEENYNYQATLGLTALLTAPLTSLVGNSDAETLIRKDYLLWLYERLLQRRFSADPQLLTSTLDALKNTFTSVKEDAQQDDSDLNAINLLLQTYYDVLPEPIQQELRNDSEFMSSFGLDFIPIISINNLSFEPRHFFQAAHKVINGQRTIINPVQSDTEIIFEPIENELALKIIDPNTSKKTKIRDERFILFLDSTIEREQILYEHRNWFDCSDVELRKAITSILVTENTLQRVKLADTWRENSTYLYYKNLYELMHKQKQMHFPDLIPPSADRLISHYRFSLKIKTEEGFLEVFSEASKILLNEEGLGTTIHRLVGFPTPLPQPVLNEIKSLSEPDLSAFVRNLLTSASSPLSKIHLIKILILLSEQKPSLYRLTRRIIKNIFSENSLTEFTAFVNLLNWVNQEFNYWKQANKWQPHIRLAMVWAHTHQLFSIFMGVGASPQWIIDAFQGRTNRVPIEMFNRDDYCWFDVAHPRQLAFPVFVLMGLADSVGQHKDMVFDQILRETFIQAGFQRINDVTLPALSFLMDNTHATNTLGSFIGESYSEKLVNIFGEESIEIFSNKAYESLANEAIKSLTENAHDYSSWFALRITIKDSPPYNSLHQKLAQLLIQTSFVDLVDEELENGLAAMEFATWQLIHLQEEELYQYLQAQFEKILESLAIQYKSNSKFNKLSDSLSLKLVEIALNIALFNNSTNDAILVFSNLLSKILTWLPETRQAFYPLVQKLCEELPIEQSKQFGELLLKLRVE